RVTSEARGDAELGHGAADETRGLGRAAARVARERLVDQAAALHRARDQRQVDAVDRMRSELSRQLAVRRIGLRDDEDAARALVEAVDQAGAAARRIGRVGWWP